MNNEEIDMSKLPQTARTVASSGGAIWIWAESGELSEFAGEVIKALLSAAVLRLTFSGDEKFSDMSLPDPLSRPSNALLLISEEEFQAWAANTTEFYLYLENVKFIFDTHYADNQRVGGKDYGPFFIFVAVRPNGSKFWLTHPNIQDQERYRPLVEKLEVQSFPTVKERVIAFMLAIAAPLHPEGSLTFEVVLPDDWTNARDEANRSMSFLEILDVVWPADRVH